MYFSLFFLFFFFFFSIKKRVLPLHSALPRKKEKKKKRKQKLERQKSIVNLFDNDLHSGVGAQFLAAA